MDLLQEWYERHWKDAEPISEEILKVIERHTREYSPFEIYAKALESLRIAITIKPLVFKLLPKYFTLSMLQNLYEQIIFQKK